VAAREPLVGRLVGEVQRRGIIASGCQRNAGEIGDA
jgi:hypothetical protein